MEELELYIKDLCSKEANLFSPNFFEQHIKVNEEYSLKLADVFNADKSILIPAVYLHDISAITDFSKLSEHASLGAIMATEYLKQQNYDSGKILEIAKCIETHSIPIAIGKGSLEQVCLSNADAISQIVKPMYWLYYAFNVRKFNYAEGRNWYISRLKSHWELLVNPAKDMIEKEYFKVLEIAERY